MKSGNNINVKKLTNLFVTITGTILLVFFIGISIPNFVKDSRLLGRAVAAEPTPTATPEASTEPTYGGLNEKNLSISSRPDVVQTPEETPKPKKVKTQRDANAKVFVKIINYTGDPVNAATVKDILESNGYRVATEVGSSNGRVTTKIINKNSYQFGSLVKRILKTGRILNDYDENSKYDVYVILGDDYVT